MSVPHLAQSRPAANITEHKVFQGAQAPIAMTLQSLDRQIYNIQVTTVLFIHPFTKPSCTLGSEDSEGSGAAVLAEIQDL